jgi:type II secretory pathway predicted ATPase ExeA
MYESFYNLDNDPFRLLPDPGICFPHRSCTQAWAYLRYALKRGEGIVVVSGRPGSGKTTLAERLLGECNSSQTIGVRLVAGEMSVADVLRKFAYEMELPVEGKDRSMLTLMLERHLLKIMQSHRRVLLAVDEAQTLSHHSLEALRLLSDLQAQGKPVIQLVLFGQEELEGVIGAPGMEQFQQRVIASCRLLPMDLNETKSYLEYRLTAAGWRGDPTINGPAVSAIFQHSGGVPRHINKICSRLFLHASSEGKHALTERDVIDVVNDLRQESLVPEDREQPADKTGQGIFDSVYELALVPPTSAPASSLQNAPFTLETIESQSPDTEGLSLPTVTTETPVNSAPDGGAAASDASRPRTVWSKIAASVRELSSHDKPNERSAAPASENATLENDPAGAPKARWQTARDRLVTLYQGLFTGHIGTLLPMIAIVVALILLSKIVLRDESVAPRSAAVPPPHTHPIDLGAIRYANMLDEAGYLSTRPAMSDSDNTSPDTRQAVTQDAVTAAPASGPDKPVAVVAPLLGSTPDALLPPENRSAPGFEDALSNAGGIPSSPPTATADNAPHPKEEATGAPELDGVLADAPVPGPKVVQLADDTPFALDGSDDLSPALPASGVAPIRAAPASAPVDPAVEVASLLKQGKAALAANNLLVPREDSAYRYFTQALKLEPDNAQALVGLQQIVDRYAWLAKRAIGDRHFDRAERFVDRALQVQPQSTVMRALKVELRSAREDAAASTAKVAQAEDQPSAPLPAARPTPPRPSNFDRIMRLVNGG